MPNHTLANNLRTDHAKPVGPRGVKCDRKTTKTVNTIPVTHEFSVIDGSMEFLAGYAIFSARFGTIKNRKSLAVVDFIWLNRSNIGVRAVAY